MNKTENKKAEELEAEKSLKALLNKSDKNVYSIVEHVSRSGMQRTIDFFVIVDGRPARISHLIARMGMYQRTRTPGDNGIKVNGCGMDMRFSVIYNISRHLYKGTTEKDAGYLLKQAYI